jgi:hypothetical protein
MRKIIGTAVATAAALVTALPMAAPAAADSSSCTHSFSGPQICIRLEGRNGWNNVAAIWTNPSRGTRHRPVWVTVNGRQYGPKERATRVGGTLSYRWSGWEQGTDAKICIRFARIDRVACEHTKYTGDRANF